MIVLKCLQKPADLRYSSASALASDLRAWLNNEPVSARSSTVAQVMTRLFRESHHVAILENWGLLWMWHSLVLLILCLTTNAFQFSGVDSRWPYVGLWVFGLGLWAAIFWNLRHRAGPITAIERQIAHVWAGSMVASSMLFAVESIMNRPVLEFSRSLAPSPGSCSSSKAVCCPAASTFRPSLSSPLHCSWPRSSKVLSPTSASPSSVSSPRSRSSCPVSNTTVNNESADFAHQTDLLRSRIDYTPAGPWSLRSGYLTHFPKTVYGKSK